MLILGVTDGISCGAALVEDGHILAAVNEEALSRLKMAYGFRRASIAEVMRIAGVSPDDVDLVCAATVNNHFFAGLRAFDGWLLGQNRVRQVVHSVASTGSHLIDVISGLDQLYCSARVPVFARRRWAIRRILRRELDITAPVEFVDHSAYFTSGFTDALVVTIGRRGRSLLVPRLRRARWPLPPDRPHQRVRFAGQLRDPSVTPT